MAAHVAAGPANLFMPPGHVLLSMSSGESVLSPAPCSLHPAASMCCCRGLLCSRCTSMMSFCERAQRELQLLSRNVEVLPFPWGWVAGNGILDGECDSKLCLLPSCSDLTVLLLVFRH